MIDPLSPLTIPQFGVENYVAMVTATKCCTYIDIKSMNFVKPLHMMIRIHVAIILLYIAIARNDQ